MNKLHFILFIFTIQTANSHLEPRALPSKPQSGSASTAAFDLKVILKAVGTPQCVITCTERLVDNINEAFSFNNLMKSTDDICTAYKGATSCVKKSDECRGITFMYGLATKGFYSTCVEKYPLLPLVAPCLKQHGSRVLKGCDAKCGISSEIDKLVNSDKIQKLAKSGGNAFVVLENAGPVCSSGLCFLSCMHKGLDRYCPATGGATVDSIIRPFEDATRYLQTSPKSLVALINKRTPYQCQPFLDTNYLNNLKFFGSLPDPKYMKPSGKY